MKDHGSTKTKTQCVAFLFTEEDMEIFRAGSIEELWEANKAKLRHPWLFSSEERFNEIISDQRYVDYKQTCASEMDGGQQIEVIKLIRGREFDSQFLHIYVVKED